MSASLIPAYFAGLDDHKGSQKPALDALSQHGAVTKMRGKIRPSLLEYEHATHDYSHVVGKPADPWAEALPLLGSVNLSIATMISWGTGLCRKGGADGVHETNEKIRYRPLIVVFIA